jgi:hypothetical protein
MENKIIEVAKKYVGMKENDGNKFDENSILGQVLHKAGQKDGEAWCAYFAEAVFCEACPDRNSEFRKIFSASAVKTYENFQAEKFNCGSIPMTGALVVWKRYKDGKATWQGHVGIVSKVNPDGSFYSIEGNTNSAGSREGDSVQEKLRKPVKTDNGLNILGFVTI